MICLSGGVSASRSIVKMSDRTSVNGFSSVLPLLVILLVATVADPELVSSPMDAH